MLAFGVRGAVSISLDADVCFEKVCLGTPFRAMLIIAWREELRNVKDDQVGAAISIYRVGMSRAER